MNVRINAQLVQKTVAARFCRGLHLQCSGCQRQIVKAETAAIFQQTIRGKGRFSAKEVAKYRRNQNRDRTIDTGCKNAAIGLTYQCEATCQRTVAIGIK
ncbi:hypothetical protein D3C81_1848210 [compost metagenome]